MNRTLGKRHLQLAHNTAHSRDMDTWILDESDAETSTRTDIDESTRDFLDFTSAISGDDLARINVFEPADPKLKPIGEQSGIRSGVRHHAVRRAAA